MSAAIYSIIEDLRHLPGQDLLDAARYIHQLREARRERRLQTISATSGILSGPEGEAFEAAIEECERIDIDHGTW
jgi:hypothetical protein